MILFLNICVHSDPKNIIKKHSSDQVLASVIWKYSSGCCFQCQNESYRNILILQYPSQNIHKFFEWTNAYFPDDICSVFIEPFFWIRNVILWPRQSGQPKNVIGINQVFVSSSSNARASACKTGMLALMRLRARSYAAFDDFGSLCSKKQQELKTSRHTLSASWTIPQICGLYSRFLSCIFFLPRDFRGSIQSSRNIWGKRSIP